jgi:hypothetical protein
MLDLLLFIIPIYYIVVAAKYYSLYKKTGLLESEKSHKYYYHIYFWPYFKLIDTNPFEKLAQLFF